MKNSTPCCYIIYSTKLNRFYTGSVHDNLENRLQKHLNHSYGKVRFTSAADDWQLFLKIECISFAHARRIELHIKKMKSSRFIRNLKKYPELIENLKNRFKN